MDRTLILRKILYGGPVTAMSTQVRTYPSGPPTPYLPRFMAYLPPLRPKMRSSVYNLCREERTFAVTDENTVRVTAAGDWTAVTVSLVPPGSCRSQRFVGDAVPPVE